MTSPTASNSNHNNAVSSNKATTPSFYDEHCYYLLPMLGWFFFSTALSAYNKTVFGEKGKIHFPCPLLLTSLHFGTQWLFSHLACAWFPVSLGLAQVQQLSWRQFLAISVPCGLVTALEIGLSNLSMVTLTMSFYTLVKSATPIFIVLWAYVFGLEKLTWSLLGVVILICGGEVCTAQGEVDFQWKGFALCGSAAVLSGMRWTLIQLKLQHLQLPSPITTLRLLAPTMFVGLVVISCVLEKPWITLKDWSGHQLWQAFLLGLVGAVVAIAMVLCEFYLVLSASAIMLMIGGTIKEGLNIVVGIVVFGEELTTKTLMGSALIFGGVVWYKIAFHLEKQKRKKQQQADATNRKPTDDSDESTHSTSDESGRLQPSSSSRRDKLRSSMVLEDDPERQAQASATANDDDDEYEGLLHHRHSHSSSSEGIELPSRSNNSDTNHAPYRDVPPESSNNNTTTSR